MKYKNTINEKSVEFEAAVILTFMANKQYSEQKLSKQSLTICRHNNLHFQCNSCRGGEICLHGKRKYFCKQCKGKGICKHNIIKRKCNKCNKCNGSKVKMNTIQTQCVKCEKPSSFQEKVNVNNVKKVKNVFQNENIYLKSYNLNNSRFRNT